MGYKRSRNATRLPKQQRLMQTPLAAPTSGINVRDTLDGMSPNYCISATNFIASPQGLQARRGSRKVVTGLDGRVQTFLTYKGQTPVDDRKFAATPTKIYDVTQSIQDPTAVVTGTINGNWESVTLTTNGGNYLVACNGANNARFYKSGTWSEFSFAATPNTPGQITTGSIPSLSDWKQVMVHQRRLWVVRKNSTSAYYFPIDSIGGAAAEFAFNFPNGGYLHSLVSWTTDNSTGVSNMLCAVSSNGDVVVYQGTNPAAAATWSQLGIWALSAPVGQRCFTSYQGDVLYLSRDGLVPLSMYTKAGRTDTSISLSLLIDNDLSKLIQSNANLPGWEVCTYPNNNLLILNLPSSNPDQNTQYVYNTIMKGWTKWDGVPAQTWCVYNDELFFGSNGYVAKADYGYKDNVEYNGTGGQRYVARAQQAFSYFEEPGIKKRFLRARPSIRSQATQPEIALGFNVDFDLTPPVNSAATGYLKGNTWDTAKWDEATWAEGGNTVNDNQSVRGIGFAGSVAIAISVADETMWVGTNIGFEPAGPLG